MCSFLSVLAVAGSEVEQITDGVYGNPKERKKSESEDSIVLGSVDSDPGDRLVRLEISKPSTSSIRSVDLTDDKMDHEGMYCGNC